MSTHGQSRTGAKSLTDSLVSSDEMLNMDLNDVLALPPHLLKATIRALRTEVRQLRAEKAKTTDTFEHLGRMGPFVDLRLLGLRNMLPPDEFVAMYQKRRCEARVAGRMMDEGFSDDEEGEGQKRAAGEVSSSENTPTGTSIADDAKGRSTRGHEDEDADEDEDDSEVEQSEREAGYANQGRIQALWKHMSAEEWEKLRPAMFNAGGVMGAHSMRCLASGEMKVISQKWPGTQRTVYSLTPLPMSEEWVCQISSQLLLYRLTVLFGFPKCSETDGYKRAWHIPIAHKDGRSWLDFYD